MTNGVTVQTQADAMPRRGPGHALALAFAVAAGPLAWGLHLVVNYGLASDACFPGDAPRSAPAFGSDWLWAVLLATDVIAIAIALAATLVAFRIWRASRAALSSHPGVVAEIGAGRTRFLAMWGVMISLGFLLAVVFDLVAVLGLRLCE